MSYLEVEDLEVSKSYFCYFYYGSLPIVLTYIGKMKFKDDKGKTFTLLGDIRYVVSQQITTEPKT